MEGFLNGDKMLFLDSSFPGVSGDYRASFCPSSNLQRTILVPSGRWPAFFCCFSSFFSSFDARSRFFLKIPAPCLDVGVFLLLSKILGASVAMDEVRGCLGCISNQVGGH